MRQIRRSGMPDKLKKELSIDCGNCSGLCCTALYFAKAEGFPEDKPSGQPCKNLAADFRCAIHASLAGCKLKGCLAYDCFGAGQAVTQTVYGGESWRSAPEKAEQIFAVFLVVQRLHQMRWYLAETSRILCAEPLAAQIEALMAENEQMTRLPPAEILGLDIDGYRGRVNVVLKKTGELMLAAFGDANRSAKKVDLIGKQFKRADLSGKDLSMTLLIAANLEGCRLRRTNLLGADLRDANLADTDLSESLFLTQGQINAARGNARTRLPETLARPAIWG